RRAGVWPTPPLAVWLPDPGGGSARPTRSGSVTSVSGTSTVDAPGSGVSHEHALRNRQSRDRHPPARRRAPPPGQARADPAAAGPNAAMAAVPLHVTPRRATPESELPNVMVEALQLLPATQLERPSR